MHVCKCLNFALVVVGQPAYDVQVLARLTYDAHSVLVYSWHNALQPVGQCDHILLSIASNGL